MSSVPLPRKESIAKEIGSIASTLSNEMQTAALKKARELGFDVNKGRIPLEETFINLSHDRDILADAARSGKLAQLPLKIQYVLFGQAQKISETLTALVNGTDALQNLEDSVEDLTASIWQYNLHNLSREVLGFQEKMNQLKNQETLIRKAHREAEEFETSAEQAKAMLLQIEGIVASAAEKAKSIPPAVEQASVLVAKVVEQEQVVAGLVVRTQQSDTAAAQHEANAKTANAEIQAIAAKLPALQNDIEELKTAASDLNANATGLLSTVKTDSATAIKELRDGFDALLEQSATETQQHKDDVAALVSKTSADFQGLQADQAAQLTRELDAIKKAADVVAQGLVKNGETTIASAMGGFESYKTEAEKQQKTLVTRLEELEGQISQSIQRATGFTLFHSFQKRQIDLARSKNVWAIALGCVVAVSIGLSAWFIYWLSNLAPGQTYGPLFYLKLSISLPIIYAITFCSLQYSRERRLEEEYAFKSTISISLEPYQKLVEGLVNKQNPEELAKYTAFIIESVGRVFTSPTGLIFDDHPKDNQQAAGIVKAVGDVVNTVIKSKS